MTICPEMRELVRVIRQRFPKAVCRLNHDKNVRDHQFDDYLQIKHGDKLITVCHGSRTQRQFGMAWYVSWADPKPRSIGETTSMHESPAQVMRKLGRILRTKA